MDAGPGRSGQSPSGAYRPPAALRIASPPSSAVKTQQPPGVTATVCSQWQATLPSRVTTVQSSSSTSVPGLPRVTIGSTATVAPTGSFGPRPGRPRLGTSGFMCIRVPMPWPVYSATIPYLADAARMYAWTADEMSPTLTSGRTRARPAARDSRVTSLRVSASGATSPTATVNAATPWTISSLTEMQTTAGYGGIPKPTS